jgi:uncharacterized protein DUF4446
VEDLTTTTGIVALAAVVAALATLAGLVILARRIRRLQAEQRTVLGEGGQRDLVAHAVELQRGFTDLSTYVEEIATRLDARLGEAEGRLDGAITFRGIVRYDAYNEMSGRQSTSIALLDAHRSGVVLSTIHHRDQARMYAKQIVEGEGLLQLSPEEQEAVRIALTGEMSDTAERA